MVPSQWDNFGVKRNRPTTPCLGSLKDRWRAECRGCWRWSSWASLHSWWSHRQDFWLFLESQWSMGDLLGEWGQYHAGMANGRKYLQWRRSGYPSIRSGSSVIIFQLYVLHLLRIFKYPNLFFFEHFNKGIHFFLILDLSFKVVRHCSLFSRRAQNSIKLGRKTVTNHWLLLGLCQCYLESMQGIRPINLKFAPLGGFSVT